VTRNVEDNFDDAYLLTHLLKRTDIFNPLETVKTVYEATDFLQKHRAQLPVFVIISLDLFLKGCDQVSLIRKLLGQIDRESSSFTGFGIDCYCAL
jgi:CheY-like chemotaxis protein